MRDLKSRQYMLQQQFGLQEKLGTKMLLKHKTVTDSIRRVFFIEKGN